MNFKDKKVGVLMGGMSSEREVSFSTGNAVIKGLTAKGYDVVQIDAQKDLAQLLLENGIEVVYNALHGKYGEDGCIQGLLEVMKIPYTGSGITSSAIAMDKQISNTLAKQEGLDVPKWQVVLTEEFEKVGVENIKIPSLPVVVKPVAEGSSVGISIVEEKAELKAAFIEAFKWDRRILVQECIKGREITVALLDGKALGTVEVTPRLAFYNYKAKYTKGMTDYQSPAPILDDERVCVHKAAEKANAMLFCEGATRADFIRDEKGVFYFLEVNTLPGLTETSLVPMVAASTGIPFEDLVEQVLSGARLKMGR